MLWRILGRFLLLLFAGAAGARDLWAQDYEQPPIRYATTAPNNRVSVVLDRIAAGQIPLEFDATFGYLRSLLQQLGIPDASQVLVFSKTSLQRQRIAPYRPRAVYFGEDAYVGYCQQGEVLEVSAVDPALGAVFYTVEQQASVPPKIVRQLDNCLICHSSSQTGNIPGHVLRSLFVDPAGEPILSAGTYRVDQTTPLENRWGGWYVTGTHGPQKHLGNLVIKQGQTPRSADNSAGMNCTDLAGYFDTAQYLTPHSDIVALLVLEHQAQAQNLITRANFVTRQALHYQQTLNQELGEPADHVWESTTVRIRSACEPLVEYLLFSGETGLVHPVSGTSQFAQEFMRPGPRDQRGRSLRELDLKHRLFRYPCSYLVYSAGFQQLPQQCRAEVLRRMWEVLTSADPPPKYAHLSPDDRRAILEILRDTLPDLPDYWRTSG